MRRQIDCLQVRVKWLSNFWLTNDIAVIYMFVPTQNVTVYFVFERDQHDVNGY